MSVFNIQSGTLPQDITKQSFRFESNPAPVKAPDNKQSLINSGYKADLFEDGMFKNFISFMITLFIPIIGPLYWIRNAILNFTRTKAYYYKFEHNLIPLADETGEKDAKADGYRKIKVFSDNALELSFNERLILVAKGASNLIVALLIIVFHYYIYQTLI